jgi:hypothetical protein
MINNKEIFNKVNLYIVLNKYYLLSKTNKDITLENFLDFVIEKMKNKDSITSRDFMEFLTFINIDDIAEFMLNDAKVNPKKYLI